MTALVEKLDAMDARGWIAIGSYILVLIVFLLILVDRSLLKDDFFKTVATIVLTTGWMNGAVSWAFSTTKTGGELAQANADIVKASAAASPPINDPKAEDKL